MRNEVVANSVELCPGFTVDGSSCTRPPGGAPVAVNVAGPVAPATLIVENAVPPGRTEPDAGEASTFSSPGCWPPIVNARFAVRVADGEEPVTVTGKSPGGVDAVVAIVSVAEPPGCSIRTADGATPTVKSLSGCGSPPTSSPARHPRQARPWSGSC